MRLTYSLGRVVLVLALTLSMVPMGMGSGFAMIAPADQPSVGASTRADDLQSVQRVLEMKMVQQRLLDVGLTPDDVTAKLAGLSDSQLHQLAAQIDSVVPAGFHGVDDIMHGVLAAVLVVILVVGLVIGLSFL